MPELSTSTCSWCGEQIEPGQLTSKCSTGEIMHFGCACEADAPDPADPEFYGGY